MTHYDLIVIGSGPAGQKGAIAAAKLNKRVAIVERRGRAIGGVCLHTGTIPSKTMREAILHLTGFRQREVYADQFRRKRNIRMEDLSLKLHQVTDRELEVIQDQLERNGVDVYTGNARFLGPHDVEVEGADGETVLRGANILLACGTRPSRPDHIPFDGESIFDTDEFLHLQEIPRSMIVVGAGVIGIEYAIMFATLGVDVTVVDGRDRLLDFCDREIVDTLLYHARALGVTFRLGEDVTQMKKLNANNVIVELKSGKRLMAATALFSAGRVGDTERLDLAAAGLQPDKRGRVSCDENYQTDVSHIYGVGDIVGFPALASTAMEQGRRAASHAFGHSCESFDHMPYGLFTIPEISMVGQTEQELTKECVPYEVGIARFSEIARGQIVGDQSGMLKLLFRRDTLELLGVHCIGESATEIVHIGQTVMALSGTIEYLRDAVFNYPTMAECYKVAALDGLNKHAFDLDAAPASADENEAASLEKQPTVMPPVDLPPVESVSDEGVTVGTTSSL